MDIEETINGLKKKEKESIKKGFRGDAVEYAFRKQVLRYLIKLVDEIKTLKIRKKRRNSSKWNKHVAKYISEGKSMKQASIEWKKEGVK